MTLALPPSPCTTASLRAIDPERYAIVNEAAGGELIEEIEARSGGQQLQQPLFYFYPQNK